MSMSKKTRMDKRYGVKPAAVILLLFLIFIVPLLLSISCKEEQKEEQHYKIAAYSLSQVIQIAMEFSPECRLQLPGEKGKG
jgi:hypothetical protein